MIVADTDVLIDALRGKEPAKGRVDLELSSGTFCTTAINAFELRSGAKTDSEKQKVEALLAALTILPFDNNASSRSVDARKSLEAAGATIGMADYLIAGVCLSRGAILLTRNRAHFERVEGLALGTLILEAG